MTEINRIGLILDTLESMGLRLSLEKSYILLALAGPKSRKLRSQLLKHDGNTTYLEIPRANGTCSRIPVKRTADYLGTQLSYTNHEQLTFAKRLQCARITFHRLRRWLNTSHISLTHRLQLWRASVVSTLMYGMLAVNLTLPIIKRFQTVIFGMYRTLTRNHSFRTHDSHFTVLQRYQLEHPVHLLLRHAKQLQHRIGQRTQFLSTEDILLTVDWSTLQQNQQMLHVALEVQSHVSPTADQNLEVPLDPIYACSQCDFAATSIANLRRHQTTVHKRPHFRSSIGHTMACAVNGLPQCVFCFKTFTTWRNFQIHLDRQCCQVRPCDRGMNLEALLREEEEQRILRLHQNLTAQLLTKEYGRALLQVVATGNWNALQTLVPACKALAHQCCVCDFHFNRAQELHVHLRVHHPQWVAHTFTKASQLCRGFASNSPCRYCDTSFRQAHSCPVLTQAAMLMLHMPTESGVPEIPPRAALRCDICGLQADSLDEIHDHLATAHRLAFHDWQPERDLMGSDPACNHCATPFASVSAVRQHVTLGQCRAFDPCRSPFLLPIADELTQMLQTGDFQQFLRDPMKRMRMTLHCAQCGARYTRSNDLMLHLQTAHSVMWNQAQAMTRLLIKVLTPDNPCVCNPNVGRITLTHVCPFFRQMVMLSTRSSVELFLPWRSDRGSLETLLHPCHQHAAVVQLLDAIQDRQLTVILQNPVLLEFLRSTCVLCGGAFHPALLRDHVLHVHDSNLSRITEVLPFIYDVYMKVAHTDFQCAQCNQIFNLPLLGDPPLAEQHTRQTLVLAHFQQCPVIHQVGLLLTDGLYRDGRPVWQRDQGAPGNVCGDGTLATEKQPGSKRRRTGHQEGQDPAQTCPGGQAGGSSSGGVPDGSASDQAGLRSEPSEKARLLRLLHANGARIGDPRADGQGQELAPGDGTTRGPDEDAGVEAVESDSDADAGANASAQTDAPLQCQGDRCALADSAAASPSDCSGGVLLSEMGPSHPEADADGPDSHRDGPHQAVCGSAGGEHDGAQQHPEISRPESVRGSESRPLAPADLSQMRRAPTPPRDTSWMQGMELAGGDAQAAHPSQQLPGVAVAEHDGEGQECGQRQAIQAVSTDRPFDRHAFQLLLSTLVFDNDRNHCFINAAVYASLWAILSRTDFQVSDLGPKATLIVDAIRSHAQVPMVLADQIWLSEVMQSWQNPHSQGDSAEFISHFLRGLHLDGFNMKWERRVQINDMTRLLDESDAWTPITVQFDETDLALTPDGYTALQAMLDTWTGQYGMATALVGPSPLICIHVDRFVHQGTAAAVKCDRPIHFRWSIDLPFFQDHSVQTVKKGYQLISAVAHLGSDGNGHCQALLTTWPDISQEPVNFLLTNDGLQPQRIWAEPDWSKRNVTVFWLCDCDCIDHIRLPAVAPVQPLPTLTDETNPDDISLFNLIGRM